MSNNQRVAFRATFPLLLSAVGSTPLVAQRMQDSTPLPVSAPAKTTEQQPTAPDAAGPRIPAELRRVEPTLPGAAPATMKKDSMHTITISTVALVLLVVIIVLLVA